MRGPAYLTTLLLACALTLPLMNTGCAEHRYARVYDPYRHDHHRWSPDEDAHYRHWESENHKEHREWAQRSSEEQKEYWSWRHGHGDHDRDKH